MAVIHFTKETFHKQVQEDKVTALVDFWAPWCGPCRMQGPIVDQLGGEAPEGVVIGKVNVDEEQDLATEFGVMTIPTLIVFKDGAEASRVVGVQTKQALLNMIQ